MRPRVEDEQMRSILGTFTLVLGLFSSISALAEVRFEMSSTSGEPAAWKWDVAWEFAEDGDEHGRALFARIALDIPEGRRVKKAKLKFGSFKIQEGGRRLILLMSALENQLGVLYDDGKKAFFKLKVQSSDFTLAEDVCNKNQLKLEMPRNVENFFAGMSCRTDKGETLVTISFPSSTEWVSSNIFESAGKGERWKTYGFKSDDLAGRSGDIGTFLIKFGREKLEVKLKSLSRGGQSARPKETTSLYASGIVGQFQMKTTGGNPSAIQPGLRIEAGTKPLFWRLGIWADLITAFPLGGENTAQSFLEFTGSLAWIPRDRSKLYFAPLLGYDSLSQDQSKLNLSFKHGNVATGVRVVLPKAKQSEFSVNLWASGLAGGSTKNYVLDLMYVLEKKDRSAWFAGASYRMQKATGNVPEEEGEFSQAFICVGQKY